MLGKIATRSSCCFEDLWQQPFAGCWFTVFGTWHFCIVSIIWKFKTWLTGWMANTGYAAFLMSECTLPSSPAQEQKGNVAPSFYLISFYSRSFEKKKNCSKTFSCFTVHSESWCFFPRWMFLHCMVQKKIIPPFLMFQIADLGSTLTSVAKLFMLNKEVSSFMHECEVSAFRLLSSRKEHSLPFLYNYLLHFTWGTSVRNTSVWLRIFKANLQVKLTRALKDGQLQYAMTLQVNGIILGKESDISALEQELVLWESVSDL